MEKTNIQSPRGDSISITVRMFDADGREIIVGENGQIYFTMKYNYEIEDYILQKTLDNGISYVEEKGYVITLNTNDTNKLPYGKYVFDVEYKVGDFVKTVALGSIKLTNEVTFVGNEVYNEE